MTEPIYDYVPGKGWVATVETQFEVANRGKRYLIIERMPRHMELYSCWALNTGYDTNGKLNVEEAKESLRDRAFSTNRSPGSRNPKSFIYVTCIPL